MDALWGRFRRSDTAKYREPFEPLPGDVTFASFEMCRPWRQPLTRRSRRWFEPSRRVRGDPCSIWLSLPRHGGLPALGPCCGLTRSRPASGAVELLLSRALGVMADLITVAKGPGNGFLVGACIATGAARTADPGAAAAPLAAILSRRGGQCRPGRWRMVFAHVHRVGDCLPPR